MAETARFSHHMTDEDALMWNIEKDPILRSTIIAVAVFDSVPDWARLRRRIDHASRLVPRLRQRVVSPPMRISPPRWMAEPGFDLDFHLRRVRLAGPGTMRELLDALQPMATTSFDRARPLWEFTLVEGLTGQERERAALVMKVHHSVTDGVGGMVLLQHVVDAARDPGSRSERDLPPALAPEDAGTLDVLRHSLGHTTRRVLGIVRRVPATAARAGVRSITHPLTTAAEGLRTTGSIARMLAPASRPLSPIMVDRGLGRYLDVFDVALDDIQRVAKSAGASINDVFLAAAVGGARHYHERHGAAPETLRMTLPINFRRSGDDAGGNRWAPARFAVPAALDDPRARIGALGALARAWRAEPALKMTSSLATVLNRLPTAVTTALFGGMLKCCDFVATNIPGASIPLYVAGARIERLYAFAPPGGAAFNVSLLSHSDTCCIALVADTTAVPDPAVLTDCLRRGFDEVLTLG